MNKLWQEIIDRIVFFLPTEEVDEQVGSTRRLRTHPRAPYATISSKFRFAVERSTFENLGISNERLVAFTRIVTPGRQRLIKELHYRGIFPPVPHGLAYCLEKPEETAVVSQLFGTYVKELFCALRDMGDLSDVCLYLDDFAHAGENEERSHTAGGRPLKEYRYLRTRIELLRPLTLPRLTCISRLAFSHWQRRPAPRVQIHLAERLTGLRALDIVMDGSEARFPGLLRDQRVEFAEGLVHSERTRTISEARFDMKIYPFATDQTLPLPNLNLMHNYDVLGAALCDWSQTLTKFCVLGAFDRTLFQPYMLGIETRIEWPNLEFFDAFLEQHTPSGRWYFAPHGRPNHGSAPRNPLVDENDMPPASYFQDTRNDIIDPSTMDAEDRWNYRSRGSGRLARNVPCEDTMQPVIKAWALAQFAMPRLRRAVINFKVTVDKADDDTVDENTADEGVADENTADGNHETEDWEIIYEAPCYEIEKWRGGLSPAALNSRRLTFHNTNGWLPRRSTLAMLELLGKESHPESEHMWWVVNDHGLGSDRRNGTVWTNGSIHSLQSAYELLEV
ncbi:oxoglutarate iron-dependent oxygenase [Trichoderma arundinaceum]|uniref:Oxoglutarate iron-dependent oxygenase n=1 Tax=Trichoderma arundinaceum TaxID=490622 RepID=A0A395P0I9_TRIAR|nr:oxoglutarate iron-dependent oxygenase [Trichoderma arundinaceum]